MLVFAVYIVVMVILALFVKDAKYLALVMFWMLVIWSPGAGDAIPLRRGDGNTYKHIGEYNNSNPLYLQGCFRQKKKSSIFGSLKGVYACQKISVALLALSWIYFCVKLIVGRLALVEMILVGCAVMLAIGMAAVEAYYKKRYSSAFQYTENADGIWMPFRFLFQPLCGWGRDNRFSCRYYVKYEELKKKLKHTSQEMGYTFSNCYTEEGVREFNLINCEAVMRL